MPRLDRSFCTYKNEKEMTKILIISDTHGNHKLLRDVLLANDDCEYLIHLGDEPDDLEFHPDLTESMQIFSVYGLYHDKWSTKNAVRKFSISGVDFCISHAQEYLSMKEDNSISCFGHTHHRYFYQDGSKIFINPGHLKREKDRGETAGYAIIELNEKPMVRFYDYKHKIVELFGE